MTLSNLDYWRLADELSVVDAAILITGNDPSGTERVQEGFNYDLVQRTNYVGYEAAFKSLRNAILTNKLSAAVAFPVVERNDFGDEPEPKRKFTAVLRVGTVLFQNRSLNYDNHDSLVFLQAEPDWSQTTVDVSSIKSWLRNRGVFPDFFFPSGNPDSIMNKEHPRYSAKLACALAAWEAVKFSSKNKTPKQTIEAWVMANGVRFGLQGKDGTVPGAALEEVSKVVNWQPQGGAARTGGQVSNDASVEIDSEPNNLVGLEVVESDLGKTIVVPS